MGLVYVVERFGVLDVRKKLVMVEDNQRVVNK